MRVNKVKSLRRMVDKNVGSGAGLGLNLETATRQLSVALRLFAVMSPSECPPYRVVVKTPGPAKLSELCLHFGWAPYTFSCWVLFLRVSWPIIRITYVSSL